MRKIPTSEKVYVAIMEAHPELKPFGSYTAVDGEAHNPSRGVISTSYGFDGQVDPIVMYERSWDIDQRDRMVRNNESTVYWLIQPE